MIELLMILSLSQLNTNLTLASKPYTTCQYPNKCAKVELFAAKPFTTCQMPNKCSKPVVESAFQPCVWPNTCAAA